MLTKCARSFGVLVVGVVCAAACALGDFNGATLEFTFSLSESFLDCARISVPLGCLGTAPI